MTLIKKSTELVVPTTIKMMLYGQAGMRKTTTALSAPAPLLLDFDGGVKRVNLSHLDGVDIVQVGSWDEVLQVVSQEDLSPYQTIVVDTVGKMMDFIVTHKCGTRQPQLRDWGGINQEFQSFIRNLSALGKNLIFVAHRDSRKDGDETVFIPALREKSYNSIVTELDLLGYMEARNEGGRVRCTVTFDPTARNDGKNTCQLPSIMEVPTILDAQGNPTGKNDFIQKQVIAPYVAMIGKKRQEQERYNRVMAEIEDNILLISDARSANQFVEIIDNFAHTGSSKMKARALFADKVKELGLVYDKESKTYRDAEPEA